MKPVIKVVCGIIRKGDTYFIARRKPEKSLGGYWEFPGGKLEEGEDPVSALQRELLEELGMKVGEIQYYDSHEHEYESFNIELIAYSCDFIEATFEMTDHDSYLFVSKNDLHSYSLAPADIYFAQSLITL